MHDKKDDPRPSMVVGPPAVPAGRETPARADTDFLRDVDYPSSFFPMMAPVHLNYVCATNGLEGPSVESGFSYCEIGCGIGKTTNILAAANPNGQFYGIDISRRHIDAARELAAGGKLDNVEFILADISDFDASALPRFDYIALHGVYSWVPEAVRNAIIGFIDDRLAPGGVVYISYNALPGGGSTSAIAEYFLHAAERYDGDARDKAARILDDLEDMREKGAPIFVLNPSAHHMLDRLREADLGYVAHEFLAPSWRPFNFAEINAEMTGIGLRFAGDSIIAANLVEYAVPNEFVEWLKDISDPLRRETEKDFICNRGFRTDVYIRPVAGDAGRDGHGALRRIAFGLTVTPLEVRKSIKVPGGDVELSGQWFERLKELLAYDALTLPEIMEDPALRTYPEAEILKGVTVFSFGDDLCPFRARPGPLPPAPDSPGIVPAINRVLLDAHDDFRFQFFLASPFSGSGVRLSPIEALLLRGILADGTAKQILLDLLGHGLELRVDGRELTGGDEDVEVMAGMIESFRAGKIPKLVQLGLIEPAG